jgi:acyl-CoA synthetase (AMP-forming)/AMP-acid ligase II/thioesterase domain-containing protein/acyl carrier protein
MDAGVCPTLPLTIGEALARHAARDAGAPAIVCPGWAPLTFGGLQQQVSKIAAQLQKAGIGPWSRVGVAMPRGPEAALISVAVCSTAVVLPLNPNLAPGDLQAELEKIRLDALIVPGWTKVPGWAQGSANNFGLFKVAQAVSSFDDIVLTEVRPVPRPQPVVPIEAKSVAAIFRTSGTTGAAKRVPVTHENLIEMARKMQEWLGLSPADRSACILPIYYNAGFKATLLVPLLMGCSVALPATTNPQEFDQWVAELRPTWLTAAPAFLQAVLERIRAVGKPAHALRFVLSTASYLSESVRTELERLLDIPVVEFYGLCEAGMMTAPSLPPAEPRHGTVGRVPKDELAIRGDRQLLLPPGQVGQVVLRGPSVTPGYLLDIDGVPSGLENGWLPTGDLGMVDEDGFLTIVGRTKEIINRGGEKISPYDVEKALLRHPAVREAAAFAVPHPRLGDNVGAAVVLHAGATATSSELVTFLYDLLAPFQMPRQVHVMASLPLGVTGKISRQALTALYSNTQRHAILPDSPLQIQIAEIWHRLLGRTDVGIDDDFFELGGDSLQATEMLLALEEVTRHRITPGEVRAELTIRQLSAIMVGNAVARAELVVRVKDGIGSPLFLCHGDFDGWGFYAFRLAEFLNYPGPIYLIHSNLDEAAGIDTIEEMAHRYLPHMLAAWPTGPFRLAGYCHGGLAAWEIAHELEEAGRKVEQIVLIDTFSLNARAPLRAAARLISAVASVAPGGAALRERGMPSLWGVARRIMQKDRAILMRAVRKLSQGGAAVGPSRQSSYYRAMAKYLPPAIDCDVVCLISHEYSTKKEYSADMWKRLARSVRSESVPGRHNTCITTHVGELATTMSKLLEA